MRLKEAIYLAVSVGGGLCVVFPVKVFFVFDRQLLHRHLWRLELVDSHRPRGSSTFDLLEVKVEFLAARDLLALPV